MQTCGGYLTTTACRCDLRITRGLLKYSFNLKVRLSPARRLCIDVSASSIHRRGQNCLPWSGNQKMLYRGRCQCGAVSAKIVGEPVSVRQCWCHQCQQVAAGGATHNAIFKTEDVHLTGELKDHSYVAASGNTLTQSYCGACGTPVMAHSSARPQFRAIRLGFLEPGNGLRPTTAIWTDEAPEWAEIDSKRQGSAATADRPA